jgi:hypothetical protein
MPTYAPVSAPKSSMPTTTNLPQPRDVALPDFTSNVYVPFNFNCTGAINTAAGMKAAWIPVQTRFVLRGGYILAYCTTTCTGASALPSAFSFYDGEVAAPTHIVTVGMYHAGTTAVGDIVVGVSPFANAPAARFTAVPFSFDLGRGYRSRTKGNSLLIGGSRDIGAGIIQAYGMVWGIQE